MALPNKRRWLLIIIGLVVLINLVYFVFMRLNMKDRLVQKYVVSFLENASGGDVSIGDVTFSEKYLLIEGFRINLPERQLEFKAESIHIEYDLMQLLWRRVKNQPFAESIYVNKPYIKLFIDPRKMHSSKEISNKPPLPMLRKYFRKLNIYEGEIEFGLDVDVYKIEERIFHLNGEMQTSNGVSALLSGNTENGGILQAKIDLSSGWFNSLSAQVQDYRPKEMFITKIDTLQALYDLKFTYLPGLMTIDAGVKDIYLEVAGRKIYADSLDLDGDSHCIEFRIDEPVLDGNKVEVSGNLLNTFSSRIGIDARFKGDSMSILTYLPIVKGTADVQGTMQGRFTDFQINARAESDSLIIAGQALRQAEVTAVIGNRQLEFNIQHLEWENNQIDASGFFGYDMTFYSQAKVDSFTYSFSDIGIKGSLVTEYGNKTQASPYLILSNATLHTPWTDIDKLELKAEYNYPQISITMHRLHNDLSLMGNFYLQNNSYDAKLEMRRFQLGKTLDNILLPICTGSISCFGTQDKISLDSNLRFYDQHFGSFDGRIQASGSLDFRQQQSLLELHTTNAKYNYEKLQIDLKAEGNLDSIGTTEFNLNNLIQLDASFFSKPEPAFKFCLNATELDPKDIMRYLVEHSSLDNYIGKIKLELEADSRADGIFKGSIQARELQFAGTEKLALDLSLLGDKQRIDIASSRIFYQDKNLGNVQGNFSLYPKMEVNVWVDVPSFDLKKLFPQKGITGTGNAFLGYSFTPAGICFNLQMEAEKLNYQGIWIDKAEVDISQLDSLLVIRKLHFKEGKANYLQAEGEIGFNIMNSRSYQDTSSLQLEFSGDLLRVLQNNLSYVKEGRSQSSLKLSLAMGENGFDIHSMHFDLKGRKLLLKDQQQPFKDIDVQMSIAENVLNIQNFEIGMGYGKLLLENSVGYNEEDMYLHQLNIGQILIYTSREGVEFHVPRYTAPKSLAHLKIKGRNTHYMRMFVDDGEVLLRGDLILSVTDITYPPDTANLMNWVNSFTSDIRESWSTKKKKEVVFAQEDEDLEDYTAIPMNFDLHLLTDNNVRYVTYPFKINFKPGSYVYLSYKNDELSIYDANFSAEDGTVVLVGTELQVDNILVNYNNLVNEARLNAVFSRKVADGTQIQLIITDEGEGSFPNNLTMAFSSDNADDRTDTEKLFRLRYGRGLDDITSTERQSLFQDDLIQTAGGEIENMIIDPVINQFELYVSRLLRIDYFQMETSFIYNLLSSNSDLYGNAEDQDKKYSADALLENLSFKAGKYVLDDLFLNYNVTFQKVYETDLTTAMGVYHTVSFRYDMPLDIKFIYDYQIDPYEKDSHQYRFSRTIKFNKMSDLYFKIFYPYSWKQKIKNNHQNY
ncbi:MAG: hypothetical protein K9M99_07000 [Candidatus Cloacimonetes bacterium]|nr:hypothetical protein [Candidatus Cloacimonadota bacterium]